MKRFFKTVTVAALLLALSFVLLFLPLAFLIPYEKDDHFCTFFMKDKMLVEHTPPTVFLLGGSNVAFGFDSEQMEEALHVPVVNLGINAGFGLQFMVNHTATYLKQGDILIISPEYSHFFFGGKGGGRLADLFYISKGKILPYLNKGQIVMILKNTPQTVMQNIEKLIIAHNTYTAQYTTAWFDRHGDVVEHRNKASERFPQQQSFNKSFDRAFLNYFCQRVEELRQRGITVYLFPPSLTATSFANIKEELPPLVQALEERGILFTLPPEDFAFPDSLFFDTCNHLGYSGTLLRTQKVTDCLIQQGLQIGEKP
jgi:hypothetical protein